MSSRFPLRQCLFLLITITGTLSCSTSSDPDPTDDPPDITSTPEGTPSGTPTTATIGPAGGELTSDDGALTINIPPGALSAPASVTIQPITNYALGGIGEAYRLTPDGLTFSTPVLMTFTIPTQFMEGTHPDFMDVAVQTAEGFWGVLKNRSYNSANGTLTATTSHFSDYAAISGLNLRPGRADVATGGTLGLAVQYCSQTVPGDGPADDDLVALVITCSDISIVGPTSTLIWQVNGVTGGNSTVGTIAATGDWDATYTAPQSQPAANPVAVSVRLGNDIFVSHIRVIGDGWTGTVTAELGEGEKIVANVVWKPTGTIANRETFEVHSGSVVYTPSTSPVGPNCSNESVNPNTVTMPPVLFGSLSIDHSTTPAKFSGTGTTALQTTVSWVCAGVPQSEPLVIFLEWLLTIGADTPLEVSADGQTISKSWMTAGNENKKYTIVLTRTTIPVASAAQGGGATPPRFRVGGRE
jgi:hypothetical protein